MSVPPKPIADPNSHFRARINPWKRWAIFRQTRKVSDFQFGEGSPNGLNFFDRFGQLCPKV